MPHGGDQNDPDRMKVFAIRAYNDNRQTSRGTYFSDGSSPIWFRQIDFNRWECLRKKGLLSGLRRCKVSSDSTLHNRCLLEPIFSANLGELYWSSNYGAGKHWIEIKFSQPTLLNTLAIMWKGDPQFYSVLLYSHGHKREIFRSREREPIDILKPPGHNRKISNRQEWETRREEIKQNIFKIMKPFPTEKCLPELKIIQRRKIPDGELTEIAYNSEPSYRQHGYVVLPTHLQPPYPLIIYTMYNKDKALQFALPFLRRGFALFAPDILINNGRRKHLNCHPFILQTSIMKRLYGKEGYYRKDDYHRCYGLQAWIPKPGWEKRTTWSGIGKIIWDISRGLDVVLAMPEIDEHQVGCTGFSWGGTTAMYVTAFDDRISVSSPQCTYFLPRCWNRTPGNTSAAWYHLPELAQYFREDTISKIPFDLYEVLALTAPRPMFIVEESRSSPNVIEAMDEIRKVYSLYGAEKNFVVRSPDDAHAYYREGFDWFERWLIR